MSRIIRHRRPDPLQFSLVEHSNSAAREIAAFDVINFARFVFGWSFPGRIYQSLIKQEAQKKLDSRVRYLSMLMVTRLPSNPRRSLHVREKHHRDTRIPPRNTGITPPFRRGSFSATARHPAS